MATCLRSSHRAAQYHGPCIALSTTDVPCGAVFAVNELHTASSWSAGPGGELVIDGVWPYWMDRPVIPERHPSGSSHSSFEDAPDASAETSGAELPGSSTVLNDVHLGQRIMLLTGANMSGKSTLMRAVMAVVLLGNLGLPVPCTHATVPQVCLLLHALSHQLQRLAGLASLLFLTGEDRPGIALFQGTCIWLAAHRKLAACRELL